MEREYSGINTIKFAEDHSEMENVEMKDVEKEREMEKVNTPVSQGGEFHPEFLYCGACTSCNAPPPPPLRIRPKRNTKGKGKLRRHQISAIQKKKYEEEEEKKNSHEIEGEKNEKEVSVRRSRVLVDNLDCPSQILMIRSVLQHLSGVSRVLVKIDEKHIIVDHDAATEPQTLVSTLKQLGYFASIPPASLDNAKQITKNMVRSQFYVQGICCASECPAVNKIVKAIRGVSKVQINITTKMVYVHHDPNLIDAHEIAMALHGQGFDSKVYKDGASDAAARTVQSDNVGRTTLHMENVMTKQDIEPIQQILKDSDGVKRVGVNVTESVVYVEHDVNTISADRLHGILLAVNYNNTIAGDAAEEILQRQTSALSVARSKFVESTLLMTNLSLKHLALLEKTFRQNYIPAQLRAFYPHVPSRTVKIEHNPSLLQAQAVSTLLQRFGMDTSVVIDGAVENLALPLLEDYDTPLYGGMGEDINTTLHINVILSGVFWFISVLSFLGGNWDYLEYVGLLSVLFGIPPIAIKAWRTLKRFQIDANIMMVVASLGAIALQEYDEAASVAFLFAVSEYLEHKATSKARKALGAIVTLRPEHANVIHPVTRELVVTPAEKVPVGSLVSVRTGDKICADGVVVEGTSSVDESSLTGEAVPVLKRANDPVSGGSINIGDSQLVIKTTTTVNDSAVSRLIRLVEEAQANRSPTEKLVDSFARTYTPVVVFMALLMCTVPWIWGRESGQEWTLNGLIIIVIACPCALTISTPVTYAAGLAATAQRGIIVKGGANLEALGSVDKVVFDKTGTLTRGKFVLSQLETVGNRMERKEMLGLLALMESPSSHPLSATLVQAARKEGVGIPKEKKMEGHAVLKGEGVTATVDGQQVYVGNKRLFQRVGMYESMGPKLLHTQAWSNDGGTVGFVGIEGVGIVGAFSVIDEVRPESRDVVKQLQQGGIEVIMLTGDSEGAAKVISKQVGLREDAVHSQLLPEDKLHFIGSLLQPPPKRCGACQPKSLIMMVGDGINDAPALAVADVGVAMGEGASLAMEMSDITLMDSNLMKLLYTIRMGARVVVTIQENIVLSLIAKLLVVGLTFAGKMTLLAAIASDVGVMLIVTLNGMKLLPAREERDPARTKKKRINMLSAAYHSVGQSYEESPSKTSAPYRNGETLQTMNGQHSVAEIV